MYLFSAKLIPRKLYTNKCKAGLLTRFRLVSAFPNYLVQWY